MANVQLIAAINEWVEAHESGEPGSVLLQLALAIRAMVEAGGGEA